MAYRWLDKLEPNFQKKVRAFMKEVDDKIFITESRRSNERQAELYAKWRTKPWRKVTRVRHSRHQDWLAIDFAFRWDTMYPKDLWRRIEIYWIAKKYWIDNLWQKYNVDKPHLQDDWTKFISSQNNKMYSITEEDKKEMIQSFMLKNSSLHKDVSILKKFILSDDLLWQFKELQEILELINDNFRQKGF